MKLARRLRRWGVAFSVAVLWALVLAIPGVHPTPLAAATTCESLSSLSLPDTTITMAQAVPAGSFVAPGGGRGGRGAAGPAEHPAFCRVAATLKPSSDSDIKVEFWLPMTSDWNGKYQAVGNGGWGGSIVYAAMLDALRRGYATSSTDTGHEGGSASFALGHPEKLVDFGSRSIHEMTLKARAVIAAFYGNAPRLSYFNGCSGGGRQGMKEAQRFAADYDGIIAGAPAVDSTGRAAQSIRVAQTVHADEANFIPAAKYPLIHNAVLQACDALDGVKDGVLENPRVCRFDPKVLECKGADDGSCLTKAQVESVRKIYAASINPRTKREITSLEPGSELGWATWGGVQPLGLSADMFKFVVHKDPNWDFRTFDWDKDIVLAEQVDGGNVNALETNLKPFFDRGGKLIHYHGWADPQISPGNSVSYYKSVVEANGGAGKIQSSYRMFMVPGMAHCGGGDGPNTFDMVGALERWVEKGTAPEQIVASRIRDGKVDRTRPLCPYPQVASYKGSGSTDEAANFVCK
jgi:tannase/feruloyl esterase